MSTAEALCIKNTSIDQISLGHLISKHEMFCFERTTFKHLNSCLNTLYFEKRYKLSGLNLVSTKVANNII
jgi:hypothetical protein